PTAIDLHKRLVAEVKSANPWYYEVSKCAPQEALRHLQKAFGHWFKVPKRGKPRFKKKNILKKLNGYHKATMDAIIRCYQYWIAVTDCDGFRIDAAKHIPKDICAQRNSLAATNLHHYISRYFSGDVYSPSSFCLACRSSCF
ncbi:alpha-amylase family glycosyl hydrolase, partial [Floridanema aerugineum]